MQIEAQFIPLPDSPDQALAPGPTDAIAFGTTDDGAKENRPFRANGRADGLQKEYTKRQARDKRIAAHREAERGAAFRPKVNTQPAPFSHGLSGALAGHSHSAAPPPTLAGYPPPQAQTFVGTTAASTTTPMRLFSNGAPGLQSSAPQAGLGGVTPSAFGCMTTPPPPPTSPAEDADGAAGVYRSPEALQLASSFWEADGSASWLQPTLGGGAPPTHGSPAPVQAPSHAPSSYYDPQHGFTTTVAWDAMSGAEASPSPRASSMIADALAGVGFMSPAHQGRTGTDEDGAVGRSAGLSLRSGDFARLSATGGRATELAIPSRPTVLAAGNNALTPSASTDGSARPSVLSNYGPAPRPTALAFDRLTGRLSEDGVVPSAEARLSAREPSPTPGPARMAVVPTEGALLAPSASGARASPSVVAGSVLSAPAPRRAPSFAEVLGGSVPRADEAPEAVVAAPLLSVPVPPAVTTEHYAVPASPFAAVLGGTPIAPPSSPAVGFSAQGISPFASSFTPMSARHGQGQQQNELAGSRPHSPVVALHGTTTTGAVPGVATVTSNETSPTPPLQPSGPPSLVPSPHRGPAPPFLRTAFCGSAGPSVPGSPKSTVSAASVSAVSSRALGMQRRESDAGKRGRSGEPGAAASPPLVKGSQHVSRRSSLCSEVLMQELGRSGTGLGVGGGLSLGGLGSGSLFGSRTEFPTSASGAVTPRPLDATQVHPSTQPAPK